MTPAAAAPRIAVPRALDPAALASFDPGARIVSLGGATMGTTWQVKAALPPACVIGEHDLTALITARLDDLCAQLSHWDAGSALTRFNLARAGTAVVVPDDFAAVMACALGIAAASGSAFDPALGRLTDVWGLGLNPALRPPEAETIAAILPLCGWQRLAFDPVSGTLVQPGGVWLDLSGIAKGYGVDAVADLLGALGLAHALVEIGGECVGRGMRPDGDPWWVELENPPCCQLPALRIALHQLAAATSGDYLRGAHTLDPATGQPVCGSVTAASVLHPSCMIADAWATALSAVPIARAKTLARRHDLAVRLATRDGEEWLSPALQLLL